MSISFAWDNKSVTWSGRTSEPEDTNIVSRDAEVRASLVTQPRVGEFPNEGDRNFSLAVSEVPGVVAVARRPLWIFRHVDAHQVRIGRVTKESDGGWLSKDCEQGVGVHNGERSWLERDAEWGGEQGNAEGGMLVN